MNSIVFKRCWNFVETFYKREQISASTVQCCISRGTCTKGYLSICCVHVARTASQQWLYNICDCKCLRRATTALHFAKTLLEIWWQTRDFCSHKNDLMFHWIEFKVQKSGCDGIFWIEFDFLHKTGVNPANVTKWNLSCE